MAIQVINSQQMPPKPLHTFIYGALRSGKTTVASTFPKPVFLSAGNEGGDTTLRFCNADVIPIGRSQDMKEAIDYIAKNRDRYGWRTIVVDSITYYSDIFLQELTTDGTRPMRQRDWGMLDLHLQKWLLPTLRNVPMHVVWIALEESDRGPEGQVVGYKAMLYGKCLDAQSLVASSCGFRRMADKTLLGAKITAWDTDRFENCAVAAHLPMGKSRTLEAILVDESRLIGTPEHPILVMNESGDLEFREIRNLNKGDYVALPRATNLWGSQPLDPEIAYILGVITGDGVVTQERAIKLCRRQDGVVQAFKEYFHKHFGYQPKTTGKLADIHGIYSKQIRARIADLGVKYSRAAGKVFPTSVLNAPRESVAMFIRGLFDTDGFCNKAVGQIEWSTASESMAYDVQTVLRNFGVHASLFRKVIGDKSYWRLSISGRALRIFAKEIGFLHNKMKADRLQIAVAKESLDRGKESLPHQAARLKRVWARSLLTTALNRSQKRVRLLDGSTLELRTYTAGVQNMNTRTVERLALLATYDEDITFMLKASAEFVFVPIKQIRDGGEREVFDLTIPGTHNFVANGIVCHNTSSKLPGSCDLIMRSVVQQVRTEQGQLVSQFMLRTVTADGAPAGGRFGAAFADGTIPAHFAFIAHRIGPFIGEDPAAYINPVPQQNNSEHQQPNLPVAPGGIA